MDSETPQPPPTSDHAPDPPATPQEANAEDSAPQNVIDLAAAAIDATEGPGQLVEHTKREAATQALFLKSAGISTKEVERRTGLSHTTIRGLLERHDETYKMLRADQAKGLAALSHKLTQVLAKKVDRMDRDDELLDRTAAKDLAITMGITTEKMAAAHGEASQVSEVRHTFTYEDYQREVRKLQEERTVDV